MDSAKAKEILRLYRPGTGDALDPQMAEALQVVQQDPELARWLEGQCGIYIAIRNKLKQIEVPPDLKRKILLEHAGERRVVLFPNPRAWLAVAAALALLAGGLWSFLSFRGGDDFATLNQSLVLQVQRSTYNMPMTSTDLNAIREYLKSNHSIADYTLTKALEKLPGEGGAVKHWHGRPVSMVCFNGGQSPDGKSKDLYLFVVKRTDLANAPMPGGKPSFNTVYHLTSVSWSVGDKVYILAGAGDQADLQQYLD